MTDITYGAATPAATAPKAPAVDRKGVFARMLDALYEARMRQAEREIRQYLHLVPKDVLDRADFRFSGKDGENQPLAR